MAWRGQLNRNIKELRFLFSTDYCDQIFGRSFIENHYKHMKMNNPRLPILIREAIGIEPQLWARYDMGDERGIHLDGYIEEQISEALDDLTK